MSFPPGKNRFPSGGSFASSSPKGFGAFSSSSRSDGAVSLSYVTEPPDFSAISDSHVVVSFKGLLKKDGVTKAKALEELLSFAQAHPHDVDGGAEEAVLDAWTQLYPRMAIDNARRVRELSHTLQFELMKSARKRMERRLPIVVGSWLAGLYDRDRAVARAASDGLSSVLTTPEKTKLFWKKCQPQILAYATEAVQETPGTLSDERSTTADDANAKFYQVVSGSLSLVLGLLQRLDQQDIDAQADAYEEFFTQTAVSKSWTSPDPIVRKAAYLLVAASLEKRRDSVAQQVPRLRKMLVSEGLKAKQLGTSVEFITVLAQLTHTFPDVWVTEGSSKSLVPRLCGLLERGSEGASAKFWSALEQLLTGIPVSLISLDIANQLLKAMRTGTGSREPRANLVAAWTTNIRIVGHLLKTVVGQPSRVQFLRDNVFPFNSQFLFPTSETAAWAIDIAQPQAILRDAHMMATEDASDAVLAALDEEWRGLSDSFCQRMSNSLPKVSKDYQQSQDAIGKEGRRWFALVDALTKDDQLDQPPSTFLVKASLSILKHAIKLLRDRDLKPYGAASVLAAAIREATTLLIATDITHDLIAFLGEQAEYAERMLSSPSGPYLLTCLNGVSTVASQEDYESLWRAWIDSLLGTPEDARVTIFIVNLISQKAAQILAQDDKRLQDFITAKSLGCASGQGSAESWKLFETAVSENSLARATLERLAADILQLVGSSSPSASVIRSLEIIAGREPGLLSEDSNSRTVLVTYLIGLAEIHDSEVASRAASLRALIDNNSSGNAPLAAVIERNLETAGPTSLEVDTLVTQAVRLWTSQPDTLEDIVPNLDIWTEDLASFLKSEVNSSLAITSEFGGAYFVTKPDVKGNVRPSRDPAGLSVSARMALYTAKILTSGVQLSSFSPNIQVGLLFNLGITAQVVSDNITLRDDHGPWASLDRPPILSRAEDFVAITKNIMESLAQNFDGWKRQSDTKAATIIDDLIARLLDCAKSLTPLGLYGARALAELLQYLSTFHGLPFKGDEKHSLLDLLKATPSNLFGSVAVITGCGKYLVPVKAVSTLCNRLVSDVAESNPEKSKLMLRLILLDTCMRVYDPEDIPVAKNRIIFAVKRLAAIVEDGSQLDSALSTMICRCLLRLLPCVKDMYESWWDTVVQFCISLWETANIYPIESAIPLMHASLKLMAGLVSLEDKNEDLEDALSRSKKARSLALVELLKMPRDTITQPLDIVDELLARQIAKLPPMKDLSEIYPLLASGSRTIQTTAYTILHRAVPSVHEQYTLDTLLAKADGRLPDELLSLLLEAPTLSEYTDEVLTEFPSPIRTYLYTWAVIFDAFEGSSGKIRVDYATQIRSDNYVTPLLEFIFDTLGHSAARPLNLDKERFTTENIREYDVEIAQTESDERDMHWLMLHVLYLVFKFVPGIAKTWYVECKSRQTKTAIEPWLAKYYSPLLIGDALDSVSAWLDSPEFPTNTDPSAPTFEVKISKGTKRITAAYEIDMEQAIMALQFPPSYPLEEPEVSSVKRLLVPERRWQALLKTVQAAIRFSDGKVTHGLDVFYRSMVGTLRGHEECAICYALVAADGRMPEKPCGTCRKVFHASCLYKWFSTSSGNTCPLCRNPIAFGYGGSSGSSGGRRVGVDGP